MTTFQTSQYKQDLVLSNRLLPLLWVFLKKRWFGALCLVILPASSGFISAAIGNATRIVTDDVLKAQANGQDLWQAAIPPLIYFITLVLVNSFSRLLQWFTGYHTRMPLVADIRKTIFSHVQRHDAAYFEDNLSGKVAHSAAILPDQLLFILERCWYDICPSLCFFVSVSVFFYRSNPIFAAIAVGWLTIYFSIIGWMGRKAARKASIHNEAKTKFTGLIIDVISNIKSVISHASHKYEDRLARVSIEETRIKHSSLYLTTVLMRFTQHMLNNLMWFAIYVGSIYAWTAKIITAGDFVMITALGNQLITRAFDIGDLMPDFIDNIGSAKENISTLIVPNLLKDAENAIPLKVTRGEICLDNVRFSYGDSANVFNNLSVTISSGQRVGLIGASGAGKTTVTGLLTRLYEVQHGKILIDGQNIEEVTQESLRSQIGLIPQDTILFNRSLMDNIRYGNTDASDAETIEAAKHAYADEFIQLLPNKYETMVGERGVKLSGGQRQRIAIARAFLKNAPILILDEATSALDSESEAVIQMAMADAMRGRTVIAIAHRLSTIAHLDRLIILKDGVIIEDGSHNELMNLNGIYAKLWRKQSGGFLLTEIPSIEEETASEINIPKPMHTKEQAHFHED